MVKKLVCTHTSLLHFPKNEIKRKGILNIMNYDNFYKDLGNCVLKNTKKLFNNLKKLKINKDVL